MFGLRMVNVLVKHVRRKKSGRSWCVPVALGCGRNADARLEFHICRRGATFRLFAVFIRSLLFPEEQCSPVRGVLIYGASHKGGRRWGRLCPSPPCSVVAGICLEEKVDFIFAL